MFFNAGFVALAVVAQWGVETPMTMTNSDVWGNGIATSGSIVHLIHGTGGVMYQSSPDEGVTWSAERQLDTGTIHLTDPIWADGTDVWIIYLKDIRNVTDWCCSRDLGNIYLLHSQDSGQTWDAPRRLTTGQGAYRVSMTQAAGRLHLVWMDFRSGAWDTYYLRSANRGATWDAERRIAISAGTFGAERPQVAARGDSVHVTIWDDRGPNPPCMAGPTFSFMSCPDTFYIRSLDGGLTWGTEVNVANSGAAIAGRNDIAVAGASSAVIVFNRSTQNTADANPHVFTIHSPDDGTTWDAPVQLTNTPGQADHGSIIGSGSDVHLAWHDSRNGNLVIYYAGSSNEGVSWNLEERVSNGTTADSSTPLVAATSGFVHIVWLDHRSGTWQVYYRRRTLGPLPPSPDAGNVIDAGATCPNGQCGGMCVDLESDPSNCGMCGRAVCHTEVCMNGAPSCAPGRTACNSGPGCLGCKDLQEDPANCGMCGRPCNGNDVCTQGQCMPMCPAGVLVCGLSCVADPQNDVAHCGDCMTVCNPGQYCTQGRCMAMPGGGSDAGSGTRIDAGGRDTGMSAVDAGSPSNDSGGGTTMDDGGSAGARDAEIADGSATSPGPGADAASGGLGAATVKGCGCTTSSRTSGASPLLGLFVLLLLKGRHLRWLTARGRYPAMCGGPHVCCPSSLPLPKVEPSATVRA